MKIMHSPRQWKSIAEDGEGEMSESAEGGYQKPPRLLAENVFLLCFYSSLGVSTNRHQRSDVETDSLNIILPCSHFYG